MVMQVSTDQGFDEPIASLLAWWRDAGVDVAIDEAPRNWLAQANASPSQPTAAARPAVAAPPPASSTALPDTLDAFQRWLAEDQSLLNAYPIHCRVAPQGDPAGRLMLIAEVPERGDTEASSLLSGEVGALLDRMLAAVGQSRSTIYLATVAPARPPSGRLTDDETDLLAPIVRQHVRLVAPAKLWLLGRAASRAVLGLDDVAAAGRIHGVNLDGVTMDAIATLHPRVLLANPKFKGRVWADMQRLFEDRPE